MDVHTVRLPINRLLQKHSARETETILGFQDQNDLDAYEHSVARQFAKWIGRKHCQIVDSGTTALKLALLLAGIKPGDEVLVPDVTYYATALPILEIGAVPVFVDADEYLVMNPEQVKKNITSKTRAILPAHIFGHACDMKQIAELAQQHDLKLIEDCCQSHGSTFQGKLTGTFGHIAGFSFTIHKNIPAFYGGCVVYDDDAYESVVKDFFDVENDHERCVRFSRANARLSPFEVAQIKIKTAVFDMIKQSKRAMQHFYCDQLSAISGVQCFPDPAGRESVRQHFVIQVENRDAWQQELAKYGVIVDQSYRAMHTRNLFKHGARGQYPVADTYDKHGLHLPSYAFITKEELEYVASSVKAVQKTLSARFSLV